MAIPTILPSGQLHPDLVNNAAFVKHVGNTATGQAATGQVGAKARVMDEAAKKQKEEELTQLLRSNVDVIDLSPMFSRKAETSDKTVIDNRASCGLIIETIDPTVITADDANKSSLSNSFSSALSEMRAMVQQYCDQHGLLNSHVGLAGATDNVSKFFQSWLDRI